MVKNKLRRFFKMIYPCSGQYTDHSTFQSPERVQARDQLFNSPHMLSLIRKTFHNDFKIFDFDYPYFKRDSP